MKQSWENNGTSMEQDLTLISMYEKSPLALIKHINSIVAIPTARLLFMVFGRQGIDKRFLLIWNVPRPQHFFRGLLSVQLCVANSHFRRSNHHSPNKCVNDIMQNIKDQYDTYTFTRAAGGAVLYWIMVENEELTHNECFERVWHNHYNIPGYVQHIQVHLYKEEGVDILVSLMQSVPLFLCLSSLQVNTGCQTFSVPAHKVHPVCYFLHSPLWSWSHRDRQTYTRSYYSLICQLGCLRFLSAF